MIYEMNWADNDSYSCFLLEHDINKTKEQFGEDCIKAIREIGKKYLEKECGWISAREWIKIAAEKMKDYGYRPVTPITWGHSGSDIIGDYDIDDNFNIELRPIQEDDKEWKKIVGDVLFEKSLERNLVKYVELYSNSIRKLRKKYILEDLERLRF
jgi:hypothetical protein